MSRLQGEDTGLSGNQDTEPSERRKLPIPRLPSRHIQPPKTRVSRACQSCQQQKTKCDGKKPSCYHCLELSIHCVYLNNKREKTRELVEHLITKNKHLEASLDRVMKEATNSTAQPVQETLKRPYRERSSSSSSRGSFDAIDNVAEDINRTKESRATGFLGKNSSASWMRSLVSDVDKSYSMKMSSHELPKTQIDDLAPLDQTDNHTIASQSYYDNQRELFSLEAIDPYALPPKNVADEFFDKYLEFVDKSFPIIRKTLFTQQYQKVYSNEHIQPGSKWLAALNIIFAIGSRYCSLTGQEVPNSFKAEVFFTKATSLGVGDHILYNHADLQQVQIETLIAFYFFVSSQINRAWKMIRIAAGSGIALGINMHNVNDQMELGSKEARCRLWCSVFMLEHLLSIMTGRPSCLMNSFSANAPLPVEENQYHDFWTDQLHSDPLLRDKLLYWTLHQNEGVGLRSQLLKSTPPNASLYFFFSVDLSLISQAISGHLYGARAFKGSAQMESQMDFYAKKLDVWLSAVNGYFSSSLENSFLSREQVSLALNYHSIHILLSRPYLSRPDINQQNGTRFPRSRYENEKALACIESALSLLAILPEEADIHWIYTYSPWWAMLHFLMQTTIVLLIQMAVGSVPTKSSRDAEECGQNDHSTAKALAAVPSACQKALRWLQSMARTDYAAQSGFEMCNGLFCRIESAKHATGGEVPNFPPLATTRSHSISQKQPLPRGRYGKDAEELFFHFDHCQLYVGEVLFPKNLALDSDVAWLLSAVETEMGYSPK